MKIPNKSNRLKAFLGGGFFPRELPPSFITADLATMREKIGKYWAALNPEKYVCTPEIFLYSRHRREPRKLSILNPVNFYFTAKCMSDNWIGIRKHINKSPASLSKPIFDPTHHRALIELDFNLINTHAREISSSYDRTFKTDISRYYYTIYTHTIPWCLHTKAVAKKKKFDYSLIGNQLDRWVRNGQDQQTIGIPVGPQTSVVLAEIIGASIDQNIINALKLPKSGAMLRYVDDVYLGIPRNVTEEEVRAKSRAAFQNFELEVNYEKTKAYAFRTPYDASWPDELRRLVPRKIASEKMIERFSLKAFDLIDQNPEANVALYAAQLMKNIKYSDDAWRVAEIILIRLARENQTLIPVLGHLWTDRRFRGKVIGEKGITKLLDDRLDNSIEARNFGETSWVLFLNKALGRKLYAKQISKLFSIESSICALLICDLEQRGLIDGKVDKSGWNAFGNQDGLKANMWLYAYEATARGWSGLKDSYLSSDPYYCVLHSNRVRFYDDNRNFKTLATTKKIAYFEQRVKKAISLNFEEYV
jgi:hypothetical protein